LESTYGWYWAADLLQAEGARVHLVHPLGLHWDTRRVKNDVRDATALANRLRQNDLPESWIAPPAVRELREIVRYRAKLTALRTSAKAQVHAVMAKHGYQPELDDMFGPGGQRLLDKMPFEGVYGLRVESLRDLLEVYNRELALVEREMRKLFKGHAGYKAIQAITGVGPVMAAIFCAEIGDVTRFPTARHLCSWAGVTPSVRDSDEKIRRGHITKMACGGARLTWRVGISSGGDGDHCGRHRHPSSPAHLRLRGPGHRRGFHRAGDSGAPGPVAGVVEALRGPR
jgi:transposase